MPDDNKNNPLSTAYFADDYFEVYANQVLYEASAWDLKIIFGALDQSTGTAKMKKTLAVNIPWAQIKLALFSLRLQLAVEEMEDGKIQIRPSLLPPEAPALTKEQEADPKAKAVHEAYTRIREEFLREL
jgi:hypothetical protein